MSAPDSIVNSRLSMPNRGCEDSAPATTGPVSSHVDGADALPIRLELFVWGIIGLGLLWRVLRYALALPIWGDEAMLALNLVDRDASNLLQPLEHGQVCPWLFLAGEWVAYRLLGSSEYVMRL